MQFPRRQFTASLISLLMVPFTRKRTKANKSTQNEVHHVMNLKPPEDTPSLSYCRESDGRIMLREVEGWEDNMMYISQVEGVGFVMVHRAPWKTKPAALRSA